MKNKLKFGSLVLILVSMVLMYNVILGNQIAEATSKYGSRGDEVKQIQTKLKNWGYYNGSIDGVYGSGTLSAVKSFQKKNGLTVDGVAGTKTLQAMGIYSSSSSSSSSSSGSSNLNLISRFVHAEARGEPYTGQVAVAAVILNRVKDSRFPNTTSGVVYQPGAFTCVSDGQINLSPNETSRKAAQDAINGWDPTYGAVYYFNPATATNKWIWSRPVTVTIGKHRFCK
ncbi:MAG: spore cortex-lytic enzyme [Clostridia bacterium]|nr:spore cortex-lytic enzyme [Clostridia bacterium]